MEQETVDLVISDMRMPGMSGAQLFERIREKWPETVRILLTGYAEISSTIEAINKAIANKGTLPAPPRRRPSGQ